MTPALARALRTLAQAAVAALGTVSVSALVHGIDPGIAGMLQVMLTAVVSQLQNTLEDHNVVPRFLKPVPPSEPDNTEGPPAP